MNKDIIEIRWHGRGGQGAITAAKIVANAAFVSGYSGVVMAPTFGTERRGAPVLTSLKISKRKIYDLSPITEPDMVVVLDHLIVKEVDVAAGLKPGGLIIINSPKHPDDYDFEGMKDNPPVKPDENGRYKIAVPGAGWKDILDWNPGRKRR